MSDIYMVESPQTVTTGKVDFDASSFEPIRQLLGTQHRTWIVSSSTFVNPTIELFGIPLRVRRDNGNVFIESPRWPSLQVFGENTQEAIESMMGLLKDVIEEYVLAPDSELSEDAIEFKQYLIRKMIP